MFETGKGVHQLSLAARTRRLIEQYELRAHRSLGQNFLVNEGVQQRILAVADIRPGEPVLEVGPGPGALTFDLAARGGPVVAVELDAQMVALLKEELGGAANLSIVEGDILRLDWEELWERHFQGRPAVVLGNIPYNISSPLLLRLVEHHRLVSRAVLMLQREVAERLTAPPGGKTYGSLTIAVGYRASVSRVVRVSPGSFRPSPRVDSAVVLLRMRQQPAVKVLSEKFFFSVVRGSFQQRRKVMVNSLSANLRMDKAEIAAALEECGIPALSRPEELSMEQFGCLSNRLLAAFGGGAAHDRD